MLKVPVLNDGVVKMREDGVEEAAGMRDGVLIFATLVDGQNELETGNHDNELTTPTLAIDQILTFIIEVIPAQAVLGATETPWGMIEDIGMEDLDDPFFGHYLLLMISSFMQQQGADLYPVGSAKPDIFETREIIVSVF